MSETSNWRSLFGFSEKKAHQQEVAGRSISFYPVSGAYLFKLRTVAAPIAELVMGIFNSDQDNGVVEKQQAVDDAYVTEKVVEAISADLAKVRYDTRKKNVETLMESFFGEDVKSLFCNMAMDSMRDVFPRSEKGDPLNWPTPDEFLSSMPAECVPQIVIGIFEANKGILGPFARKMKSVMSLLSQRFEESILQDIKSPESDLSMEQSMTSGSDSNTSISGQQDTEVTT